MLETKDYDFFLGYLGSMGQVPPLQGPELNAPYMVTDPLSRQSLGGPPTVWLAGIGI